MSASDWINFFLKKWGNVKKGLIIFFCLNASPCLLSHWACNKEICTKLIKGYVGIAHWQSISFVFSGTWV